MCGIIGFFARDMKENVIPQALAGLQNILHRGTDGYGATNGEWEIFEKDLSTFITKLKA